MSAVKARNGTGRWGWCLTGQHPNCPGDRDFLEHPCTCTCHTKGES